jgi:hypothetical protein
MYVAEIGGERILFKEKDFTDDIARKLLAHPSCAPMIARASTLEPTAEEIDSIVDQDEAPVKGKGRKVKALPTIEA